MYPDRYFRLRYSEGFGDSMLQLIARGYEKWKERVRGTVEQWETKGIKGTNPPEYVFGEIELSDDRTVISVRVAGDPHSYGALKIFEDGVPWELFDDLPRLVQEHVEMSYENEAMGIKPGRWFPVDFE